MGHIEQSITNAVKAKGTIVVGNTSVQTNDGITDIVLHSTKIMVIDHKKKTIKLNSGGFRTNITKSRMNLVLDALGTTRKVIQVKHIWYIVGVCGDLTEFKDNMEIKF